MDQLEELKVLAGISNRPNWHVYNPVNEKNISYTGTEKAKLQRKHKIKPGTEDWFRLWFAKPGITKETPF